MPTRRSMLAVAAIVLGATALTPVSASAFGHGGGGGGGFAGGGFGHAATFGHAAAFGARLNDGGVFARHAVGAFHPMHVAPSARVASATAFPLRHPRQPAQAGRPSWYIPWQHPFNGGAVAAAGRIGPINQAGQPSADPSVVTNSSVFGQDGQQDGPPATVPGFGGVYGGASQLNNPGSQNGEQQAAGAIPGGAIPGVDSSFGGAGSLNNTASDNTSQGDIDAAAAAINQAVGQANGLIDQGMQGGANGLNIPSQAGAGAASDDDPDDTPPADSTASDAQTQLATAAATMAIGVATGQLVSVAAYSLVGLIGLSINDQGSEPDPTDSGATTSTAGGLATASPALQTDRGGGTGNNTETNGGATGGLAPGSSYTSRTHGDGGGDDAGDNSRIGKGGALASGSALTSKDQGDGGSSDTRGGGGNSTVTGSKKVVGAGGGHNQLSGTVTGAN